MKKQLSLLFLASLLLTQLHAHPPNWAQQICAATTVHEVLALVGDPDRDIIQRVIVSDFQQIIVDVEKEQTLFRVYLVARGDTIIAGTLQRVLLGKVIWQTPFAVEHRQLRQVVSAFNHTYGTHYSKRRFLKALQQHLQYSFGCGEDLSGVPREARTMNRWMKKHRQRPMRRWLTSPNPERQAYAVTGLRYLQQQQVPLSSRTQHLLDLVWERNTPIRCCLGCFAGMVFPLQRVID